MPRTKRLSRARRSPDTELIGRIGRAVMRMRRDLVKPPELCLPMPSLGRSVDAAKVHACVAIAEGGDPAGEGLDAEHVSTVKGVAEALHLDHSTASRLLGEAEADGLLHRGTDPHDRRRTTVALTHEGRMVVHDSTAMRSWAMSQVFAEWSERDLKTLAAMLERMAETLSERMPLVLDAARAEFDPDAAPPV